MSCTIACCASPGRVNLCWFCIVLPGSCLPDHHDGPKLNLFQCVLYCKAQSSSHKCQIEGEGKSSLKLLVTLLLTARDVASFLCCKGVFLTYVQLYIHQDTKFFSAMLLPCQSLAIFLNGFTKF